MWRIETASSYCNNVTDGTHDSPKKVSSGKYLITSKHIKGREIDYASAYLISEEDYEKINQRSKVDQWDVIISMIGEYCGFCYVERNEHIDYAIKNVGLFKTGNKEKALWLYYYLCSPQGKDYLRSVRAGSTQPYISLTELRRLPIPVPDDEELKSMVDVLTSYDDLIANNERTSNTLHTLCSCLYEKLCENASQMPLSAIIDHVETGMRPKGGAQSSGIPSIGAEKIECFGKYDYSNEKYIDMDFFNKMKRGVVSSGDVLLYKDGAYTGKSSMALDDFPHKICAVNEHVFILRTAAKKMQSFLYFTLQSEPIRQKIYALACGKAAQPGLNQQELMSVVVPIPSRAKIDEFEQQVNDYLKMIVHNVFESKKLEEARNTVLSKYLCNAPVPSL